MFSPQKKGLYAYLQENEKKFQSEILYQTEEKSFTWTQVKKIADSLIAYFYEKGVREGQYVAFRAEKREQTLFLYLALISMRTIVTITDPHYTVSDYFATVKADVPISFIVDLEGDEWSITNVATGEKSLLPLYRLPEVEQEQVDKITKGIDLFAPNVLTFTSGSTGTCKGVLLSQYALVNNIANQVIDHTGVGAEDVNILLMPVNHVFGLCSLLSNVIIGYKLFLPSGNEPNHVLDCVEKYRVSIVNGVPTFFFALIEAQKKKPRDISSIKSGILAGSSFTTEQFATIERELGITLCTSYGMTETCAMIAGAYVYESFDVRKDGSDVIAPGVQCVFKDNSGKEVPKGGIGEICVKGFNLMIGYYGEDPKQAFDEDGYFHTGDLGRLDENNRLHVVGRKKDLIIRGGENLSPVHIEEELGALPYVRYACVVGVKDEYYGERVGCAFVLREGERATAASLAERLKKDLQGKLSKIEIPEKIILLQEMPLNHTGKVNKLQVREWLEKGSEE